jgi:hypothetical protein
MRPSERDVTKLPQWAQRRIEKLERDLAHARDKLSQGPENSDTFADAYSENPRPLGQGTTIRFVYGDRWHQQFQARLDGDTLHVSGGNSIFIEPRASNSVYVKVGR